MIKLYLYILIIPLSMLALESVNTNGIFKKNRIPFIKILFLMLSFALSYLVVNFLIDFSECFNFLR
jgi:uncharacterized membrane protein YwzB